MHPRGAIAGAVRICIPGNRRITVTFTRQAPRSEKDRSKGLGQCHGSTFRIRFSFSFAEGEAYSSEEDGTGGIAISKRKCWSNHHLNRQDFANEDGYSNDVADRFAIAAQDAGRLLRNSSVAVTKPRRGGIDQGRES